MKKHKFNWIDGLVLAVVVLLIAGTCVKFLVKESTSKQIETTEFSFALTIQGVRQITVDALREGDLVYDQYSKTEMGTITGIIVTPAQTTISHSDGTLAQGTIDDRYDITLIITTEGTIIGDKYEIGTFHLQVNHSGTYYTKYSIWSAVTTAIYEPAA